MPIETEPLDPPGRDRATRDRMDALLDEALEQTFPASDSVVISFEKGGLAERPAVSLANATADGRCEPTLIREENRQPIAYWENRAAVGRGFP